MTEKPVPDAPDPVSQNPEVPIEPHSPPMSPVSGIALGCGVNVVLIILLPFVLMAVSSLLRDNSERSFASALFAIVLLVDGCVIAFAHRRRQTGIVIGFAIAASLVVLLVGICWSSF